MQTTRGNITTQNLAPAGAATAGSELVMTLDSDVSAVAVQVKNAYTGALTVQAYVIDDRSWVTISALADGAGAAVAAIPSGSNSIFRFDAAGYKAVRVTALAAMGGDPADVGISASRAGGRGSAAAAGGDASAANQATEIARLTSIDNKMPAAAAANRTVAVEQSTTGEYMLASAARSYNYNGDGTVNYEQIADGVNIFRKTYTYVSGATTAITGWVKQ